MPENKIVAQRRCPKCGGALKLEGTDMTQFIYICETCDRKQLNLKKGGVVHE